MSEVTTRSPHEARTSQLAIKHPVDGSARIVLVGTAFVTVAGVAELFCVAAIAVFIMLVLLLWNERLARQLRVVRDRLVRHRSRAKRERNRRRQLRRMDFVMSTKYDDLRERIDRALCSGCSIVEYLDLESLLDHYVRLAVTRERWRSALPAQELLPPSSQGELRTADHRRLRDEIATRRAELRDVCRRRIAELSDEIDEIDELVAFVEQRIACPDTDADTEYEMEWRLSQLAEIDEALSQLGAESAVDPSAAARCPESATNRCERSCVDASGVSAPNDASMPT